MLVCPAPQFASGRRDPEIKAPTVAQTVSIVLRFGLANFCIRQWYFHPPNSPVLEKYPPANNKIPPKVPPAGLSFYSTPLDVEIRNPQHLPGISAIHWMSLDVLE
jgi:hypothetical protein